MYTTTNPLQYSIVRVVTSTVKSDHKAVVLYTESHPAPCVKSVSKKTFRKITPNQHALFLEHISEITLHIPAVSSDTVQSQFDYFYSFATDLLNQFYPLYVLLPSHLVIQTSSRQLSKPSYDTRIA